MLDVNLIWSGLLTVFVGLLGYMMKEKFAELARLSILLNRTREEVARDNVTQAEIDRITSHIDQRFNRLEEKIDRLISQGVGKTN
jgi:hypothetical protein